MAGTNGSNPGSAMTAEDRHKALVERAVEAPVLEWDLFQASTGVILELHPIPGGRINSAQDRVPRPKPPILPEKRDAEGNVTHEAVEHFADPRYMTAMLEFEKVRRDISVNIVLYEGTKVVHVPEGMWGPDDDAWIDYVENDELTTFHVSYIDGAGNATANGPDGGVMRSYVAQVHRTGKMRYVDYLIQYALGDGDYNVLLTKLTSFAGKVLESDVDNAEDSFRDSQGRDTPTRLPNRAERRRG